jgi:hypothetical protein
MVTMERNNKWNTNWVQYADRKRGEEQIAVPDKMYPLQANKNKK